MDSYEHLTRDRVLQRELECARTHVRYHSKTKHWALDN